MSTAEQLLDRAPCGYLSTTPDGRIVKANETFLAIGGYTAHELVGRRRFVDLLSPGGRIYHETHYAPMLRVHGSVREIALDLVRSDGTRLPVLVNSVLERDEAGTPLAVHTAVFEATQRREYERELLRQKQRAERSEARATALAKTLQQTLIPPNPPAIPHLDVAARYRPAGDGSEVGGDFYDVFQLAADDWAVVIGDVCGKGVDAAVVTALARYTLRAAAVEHPAPTHALRTLNQVLIRDESDRFCTVAMLRLTRDRHGWTGLLACGGHPLPFLRRADGLATPVGRSGALIGVLPEAHVVDEPLRLSTGEMLVLFTDGIPEARKDGQFYGEQRMISVISGEFDSADDLGTALLTDVLGFEQGIARDDIAIVVVRVP